MLRQNQRLRIIGGEHRGRTLSFIPVEGLRPTPDRVRETVFNWLQHVIYGARCLDVFAGSGAMGLEAASRGAASVTFVESCQHAAGQIRQHIETLDLLNCKVHNQTAERFLIKTRHQFDVVFVDPPYDKNLLMKTCSLLESTGILKSHARIYLENEFELKKKQLPADWQLHHAKQAGKVFYHLVVR